MLLKTGSSGTQVKSLQYGLHILCCSPKSFDGSFGSATEAAVKKYQGAYGLNVDGQVGDNTWNSICGEISPIQRALTAKGYYSYSIDGIAGEKTYTAIVNFQNSNGLTPDGQVGPSTRQKLMRSNTNEVGNADFPLKEGDSGDKVTYLQYGLRILCCSPGSIDGSFGSGTTNAVKKFQAKYNLTADGIVGIGTWSKMQSLITEIQGALISKGYSIGNADGVAGPGTYEGIMEFQKANNLTSDGQVGPATRTLLLGNASDGGTDAFPLKTGSKGPYVLYLQHGLRILCINPNGLDGTFGNGTTTAVKKFQSNNGLTSDGIVGTATWEKMRTLIRPIQQALVNHGYDTGGVDGIAGEKTYNAVVKFQSDNGLTADGMVGSSTKQKLGVTSSGGGSGTTSSILKIGSNGSLVRYLQRVLNILGYSNTVDGVFGTGTANAVKAFQADTKILSADGIVGAGTWSKIFEKYKVNVSGTGAEKMANVAKYELAWQFKEDNSNNITPYGEWYGMNGVAWCAMFVSWCAMQAGILGTKVPKYAYCPSGVEWYRSKGKFYSRSGGYTPKIGDTIFFWSTSLGRVAHTGIVVDVTSSSVTTVEGNTNDGVGMHTYGRYNTYIHGYGDNGGPSFSESTESELTTEEINTAVLKKGVALLNACNNEVIFDRNTHKYEITSLTGKVNFQFTTTPIEYYIAPNIKISTKIVSNTSLYDTANSNITFTIKNGKVESSSINITDKVSAITSSLDNDSQKYINILDSLCLETKVGYGKLSYTLNPEQITVSYTLKADVFVKENSSHSYSFVYSLTIEKPDDSNPLWNSVLVKLENAVNSVINDSDKVGVIVFTIIVIALVLYLLGPIPALETLEKVAFIF